MKIHNIIALILFYSRLIKAKPVIYKEYPISENLIVSFCEFTNPKDYLLDLERLKIIPDPPIRGKEVTIEASGTLKEDILLGSYALLKAKYEFIPLISVKEDLCEQAKRIDIRCPIRKGYFSVNQTFFIPKNIIPGKYIVLSDVMTEKNQRIACFSISVVFGSRIFVNNNS
ncbi:hypothetical protein PORY_001877 [Pneumocystis oryctolagi]|uniref:Uncharacterized protein n=1 Tax=Pneumocystis oryctolagi TaxID=42067 RepID=A0ACB7CAS6_9ASCO|nr:hypothetical protein PORY_001877 [Pneumocystis oryctolagi]